MLADDNLVLSNAQAITATAASTNAYDIETGNKFATTFTNPSDIIGNATFFGEDLGLGRGKGEPTWQVFTGSGTPITATSLQLQFRGAPDNVTAHASKARSDLTFVIYIETDVILLANILASQRIADYAIPRRAHAAAMPRFYDANYVVAGSNFAGLTLTTYITTGDTSAQSTLGQYASNY